MIIRPATTKDRNFVLDAWIGSYSQSAIAASLGSNSKSPEDNIYLARWPRLIDRVTRASTVTIAADQDNQDVILGFLVQEGPVLHYLFTRQDFRRSGIAGALLDSANPRIETCTARTTDSQKISNSSGKHEIPVYDPTHLWKWFGILDAKPDLRYI